MGYGLRGFCALVVVLNLWSGMGCGGAGGRSAARGLDIADPTLPALAPTPAARAAAPARIPALSFDPAPLSSAAESAPNRVAHSTQQRHQAPGTSSNLHAISASEAAAAARDLRVMSFNIRVAIFIDALNHWQFRKELLVETIRTFDPDLLGTQEALASQSDYLRQQLHDYDFVGAGRNDGDRRGEMCGVFFRKSRFEKLASGHFWLSKTPERPGSKSWGTAAPRMVTWLKLRDRMDGSVFCLFNTHFDHRGRRAREESAKLLRQRIDAIAGSLPVIITGDFNAAEDSAPYRTLIAGTRVDHERFTDTFRATNPTADRTREGTRHGFGGGARGPRIDWIVTSDEYRTIAASIDRTHNDGRYPSDHFPVTAIVRPPAQIGVANTE